MKHYTIFLFLLIACTTRTYKPVTFKLGDGRQICLEGEGVGRFKGFDENYRFNFTSEVEDQTWLMGLRFPLHGEEVLELDLNRKRKIFNGDFYLRVRDASRNFLAKNKTKYSEKDFELFMQNMAQLVKEVVVKSEFLKECENSKQISCDVMIDGEVFKVSKTERGITFYKQISKEFSFKFGAFELEKNYFSKVSIELNDNAARSNEQLINLELSLNDCLRP